MLSYVNNFNFYFNRMTNYFYADENKSIHKGKTEDSATSKAAEVIRD